MSGGVGRLSASPITCGGGRAREEMIIAGADEGSVGLRDHIANSFLDFSADEIADCLVTSREVKMGDDCCGDVEDKSGDWGTGSGADMGSGIGSDIGWDVGLGGGSDAGSGIGSATGSGVGSLTRSGIGSGVGSETGSGICRTS